MRLLRWMRTVVEWRLMLEFGITIKYEGGIQADKVGNCKLPLISNAKTGRNTQTVAFRSWVPCAPTSFVGSNPTHLTTKG